jgi:23S rRNA (guanosine2251-2'-O)-methyltransferase
MSRSDKYNKVELKQKADTVSKDTAAEETSRFRENYIEGRNAVLEAFRSGRTIDKLYVLDGCQDGPVKSITREAQKSDTIVYYVTKERLDQLSETGKHQGVIAVSAAYAYAEVEDILEAAKAKGEAPFLFLLDGIEDPHNLGAILRTANLCGAHGVIIPKRRAVGLTPTVAKTSAGAINYTPVAKVTNLTDTIRKLKDQGMWFVCADMGGTEMYDLDLTGPIGLVIGNEGEGVSKLVKENCDMIASIPMKGDIDSLNASVACGVMAYEIVRQRIKKG